jgi:hypothetical protein
LLDKCLITSKRFQHVGRALETLLWQRSMFLLSFVTSSSRKSSSGSLASKAIFTLSKQKNSASAGSTTVTSFPLQSILNGSLPKKPYFFHLPSQRHRRIEIVPFPSSPSSCSPHCTPRQFKIWGFLKTNMAA